MKQHYSYTANEMGEEPIRIIRKNTAIYLVMILIISGVLKYTEKKIKSTQTQLAYEHILLGQRSRR
jgi:hypothetical protein